MSDDLLRLWFGSNAEPVQEVCGLVLRRSRDVEEQALACKEELQEDCVDEVRPKRLRPVTRDGKPTDVAEARVRTLGPLSFGVVATTDVANDGVGHLW